MAWTKCYLCGKPMRERRLVDTRDDQLVDVGPDCYAKVRAAGEAGYPATPFAKGVRLYLLEEKV